MKKFMNSTSRGMLLMALVLGTSGCVTTTSMTDAAKGVGASLSAAIESALSTTSSTTSASAPSSYPTLKQSEAFELFKKYPIKSDTRPDTYPRAAITITSAGPGVFAGMKGQSKSDTDCINFNINVWFSDRDNKRFDGLRMCARDRSRGVPFKTIESGWSLRSAILSMGETTGDMRLDGPQRPKANMPTDPRLQRIWAMDTPGLFFIGSILHQLGYNWDSSLEGRVWFVSLPGVPG
jgi:hypothetical protein